MTDGGSNDLRRFPVALTDHTLERVILNSTPKRDVSGRELYLDLTQLGEAEFHAVGRLVGVIEGFVRRNGTVRITPTPPAATAAEAAELGVVTTSVDARLRRSQSELARHVQNRSRANRFLRRVGFPEASSCAHLTGSAVTVDPSPPATAEHDLAELRGRPSPLPDKGPLLEVVPFRWLPAATPEEFEHAAAWTGSVLAGMGVERAIRQAVHELVLNVHEHSLHQGKALTSMAPQHMLFGVATRRAGGQTFLEILVVDGGVGIPETLGKSYRKATGRRGTQTEIVAYAFAPNSTRKLSDQIEGSARGLAVVLGAVRNAGGSMTVRSGSGSVSLRDGELVVDEPHLGHQPGTAFTLSIPFDRARQPRSVGVDDDVIDPSSLDIDSYVVHRDGSSERLVSLSPISRPITSEPTVAFVEPGCSRADLERFLEPHLVAGALIVLASTDGQGALLRDQGEAILAAQPAPPDLDVVVLDRLDPVVVRGQMGLSTARGLLRSLVARLGDLLTQALTAVVDSTAITPRRTWSLAVAARWIEPRDLTETPVIRILAPLVLASAAADQLASSDSPGLAVLDVIVTDSEFAGVADALAGWLGARHVRRIRIPQEPDVALLADEIEAASIVLTSIIHGGGATVPIIRGLLAGGRRSVTVCCLVDSRPEPSNDLHVAGHVIPVVTAATAPNAPPGTSVARLESDAVQHVQQVIAQEGGDSDVYAAIAASPGALSLGHFHSENRAWMSAVVAPSAIADPTTAIGRLIVDRMAAAIREEVAALCPGAALEVRDLGEPTPLTRHVREALTSGPRLSSPPSAVAAILVDWGALTGETAVRRTLATAREGYDAVIAAIGVDRSFQGAHHLLRRSVVNVDATPLGQLQGIDVTEPRQVSVSFVSAVAFARDHRSEIDCPLCATERSLLRLRSIPTALLNSRLRALRARMSSDPPGTETVDAFDCPMADRDVRRFLVWRAILHDGTTDRRLAHGVALRLEGRDGGLGSTDLISLSRNLALNPDLLRRRPWSSPRFRHALAEALSHFLRSNDGHAISSNMARQLVVVLRMSSKSVFVKVAGSIHTQWRSPDVREELEVTTSTLLHHNVSGPLLASAIAAATEFGENWTPEDAPPSLGALNSDIARARSRRQGDPDRQFRWHEASAALWTLPTHMGIGGAAARLPIFLSNLFTPGVAVRAPLVDGALRQLHTIQRFVETEYPAVRSLVEEEYGALARRGGADPLPQQESWLKAVHQLVALFEDLHGRSDEHSADVQRLMDVVLSPLALEATSRSFASTVLGTPSNLSAVIDLVIAQMSPAACTVTRFEPAVKVLFPRLPLYDLLEHLVENASKHHAPGEGPPAIQFELMPDVGDPVHRRVRVSYQNTTSSAAPNPDGGLSSFQWGGALEAFGGRIETSAPGTPFELTLYFQRPWGDS